MASDVLKTPWPYPGGKSKVADLVWSRLGNVANFIEPFAGSLAVLMRRPKDHFAKGNRIETVNDANSYIVNFWRAIKADPETVALFADSPVLEADLHARHRWLVRSDEAAAFKLMMTQDPDYYDPRIAGWWAWGQCCWIGSGWCNEEFVGRNMMPAFGGFEGQLGRGVHSNLSEQIPELSSGMGRGQTSAHDRDALSRFENQAPSLHHGNGVHSGRPQLADAFDIGRGVNGNAQAGTCADRTAWLIRWMQRLADRMRLVRTCYGDWSRVCDSESTLTRLGLTGAFIDPPYPLKRADTGKKSRSPQLYATDKGQDLDSLRDEVRDWCLKWGSNPDMRIAVCGYEGDGYEALEKEGWTVEAWEANGGYGNQSGGSKSDNAKRERIWFNPACLSPGATLFDWEAKA